MKLWPHMYRLRHSNSWRSRRKGRTDPANIRPDEDVLKASFVLVFRRRLQDVLKTSWSRWIYLPNSYVFRTGLQDVLIKINIIVLVIRLQDVFKMFSRRLQNVFKTSSRRLEDVFKSSCKNVFKTSSRRLQDVFQDLQRSLQDIFKTYHQVKLSL